MLFKEDTHIIPGKLQTVVTNLSTGGFETTYNRKVQQLNTVDNIAAKENKCSSRAISPFGTRSLL